MKKKGIAALLATGLAAVLIGVAAPVQATPAEPGNAQEVISQLRSQGYSVIVNRLGTGPLDEATVVAIRPGTSYERFDYGVLGGQQPDRSLVNQTIYVDVR